jgi:hypothetical protein
MKLIKLKRANGEWWAINVDHIIHVWYQQRSNLAYNLQSRVEITTTGTHTPRVGPAETLIFRLEGEEADRFFKQFSDPD